MRFRFKSKDLQALYTSEAGAGDYAAGVVDAFFHVMTVVVAAPDEREFYNIKSLHYEKLRGKRQGERSMRLNRQWRLIVEPTDDEEGKYLLIKGIEDYH